MQKKILVLGLGNILLQDEGLGVRAVETLQPLLRDMPVTTMDGGTLGLDLLPHLYGVTHLLVLDAVDADEPPGTLVRLEDEQIASLLTHPTSIHQVGVQDLLALAALQDILPPERVLLGLQPEQMRWGTELSASVDVALPSLVEAALRQLEAWGISASP